MNNSFWAFLEKQEYIHHLSDTTDSILSPIFTHTAQITEEM